MTAPELWNRIAAQFLAVPLPGVPSEYVRSFLTRYETVFVAALQKRLDALSAAPRSGGDVRTESAEEGEGDSFAAIGRELLGRGFLSEPPRHGATAVWSLKTRQHGIEVAVDAVHWGDELQLTRHQGRETTEEETVTSLEQLRETLDLWGIVRATKSSASVPESPHEPGDDLEPRLPDVLNSGIATADPWEPPATIPTPEPAASPTVDIDPVPTHDGGLRGAPLDPADVVKGDRVVTSSGAHGRVERVDVFAISGSIRETRYHIDVRLDSGRLEKFQRELFREVRPPDRVIPDISFDGRSFLSPADAWKALTDTYTSIGYHLDKAYRARKPDVVAEWQRVASESQARLLQQFATFHAWREQHPDVEIDGFISHLFRIFELMSGAAPRFRRELEQLKRLPRDQEWGGDLVAGDGVIWNNPGSGEQVCGRIASIEGREAQVAPRYGGASIRMPLYYLLLDGRTPLEVPTYDAPVYLVTLAAGMLSGSDRYPKRGAVAAAVKRFLAHHGIDARTYTPDGAGVSVIYVRAPEDTAWTADEQAFLEDALDLHVHAGREASFEPWRTQAAEWSPYQDYGIKGAGLRIAAEHVPTFAPLLASALKENGHTLNRLGTAWLIRGVQPVSPDPAPSSASSGEGPATHSSDSRAEGCRELEFHLPGYGRIRVVCGAHGRREIWNNIFIGHARYGFNGSRWSKGMVPHRAVLDAVAARGITVFGVRRVYETAENIRYL